MFSKLDVHTFKKYNKIQKRGKINVQWEFFKMWNIKLQKGLITAAVSTVTLQWQSCGFDSQDQTLSMWIHCRVCGSTHNPAWLFIFLTRYQTSNLYGWQPRLRPRMARDLEEFGLSIGILKEFG